MLASKIDILEETSQTSSFDTTEQKSEKIL